MKPEEFIIWLRGFVAASNHYNLTPAAWDKLKEELEKVKTEDDYDIALCKFRNGSSKT